VDLSVSGTTVRSALTIASAGPFNLDGIIVSGGLGSLTAEHTAISGNLTILGRVPSITVGSVSGGTWAVAGGIGSLKILGDLTAASIFAGANSGTDHVLGNADDTFLATQIISIFVGGSDTSSIIAAGIAPTDGINVFQRRHAHPRRKDQLDCRPRKSGCQFAHSVRRIAQNRLADRRADRHHLGFTFPALIDGSFLNPISHPQTLRIPRAPISARRHIQSSERGRQIG